MHPHNAQCPQCAAPLPPAATRCSFCGFATPWGATLSAVEQRAAQVQADQAKRQRIAKAESSAKTGMILALVGVPICCAPLSIVGGVMGYRGASLAKAEGIPRPVSSIIAIVAALISTIGLTTTSILYYRDNKAKQERIAATQDKLKGRREGPLDQKLACDLAEEHLAAHGHGDTQFGLENVNCDGALTVTDRRGSLPDVRFSFNGKHNSTTFCFERRSRWFVLKTLDSGTCAELPPPAAFTPPPRQFSEEEAAADEAKARADLQKAAALVVVNSFTDKLAKVRTHAAAQPGAERVCSKADLSQFVTGTERRKVSTVDYDLLDAPAGASAKQWTFLTSESVKKALDTAQTAEDRAKSVEAVQAESGALIVVYKSKQRAWPVVSKNDITSKDFSYDGGEFSGHLFVYNINSAERLCQTKLEFESSEVVSFRKKRFDSSKGSAQDAVISDFREQFYTAAEGAVKRAAPDLKLGYKVLE
ncbi:MAG: hypothetical protein IPK82_07760 [Polyangiaceae bacterium]|nr:hypothetical protein [Polyangiaceae bacterium]